MKFALMSFTLPPSPNSHGAIVYRLLQDFDPDEYCLLSSGSEISDAPEPALRLHGKRYQLPKLYQLPQLDITRGYRFGLSALTRRLNLGLAVVSRARGMARIIRAEKCDAVIAITGGCVDAIIDFPAAFLAAMLTCVPFHAYLLDQYTSIVSVFMGRSFLRFLERTILEGARTVITHNEFHRDALKRQFGLDAVVIHNPCDLAAYSPSPGHLIPVVGAGETKLVYTGGVSFMYGDALRNLMTAIDRIGRPDIRLHVYTMQSEQECAEQGVRGNVAIHEAVPIAAALFVYDH
jgi:hypothetical protein